MALGLKRYVASLKEQFPATGVDEHFGMGVAGIQLRFVVCEDDFAADDVLNCPVTTHLYFDGYPLFAVVRLAG